MPQQINLIDKSLLPTRQRLPPVVMLSALAMASALLTAHFAWEKWALAQELNQVAAPPQAAAPASDSTHPGQREASLARREALRDVLRLQVSVAEGSAALVSDIIAALSENMWLTELEVGTSRTLRLSGATADSAGFGQFAARLERISALKDLPLHTVRLEPRAAEGAGSGPDQPTPAGRQFVLVSGSSEEPANAQALTATTGPKP